MKLLLLGVGLLFVGCAHYPDVRPGENGVHRVIIEGAEKESAEREAIRQARSYCDDKKMEAVFLNEDTKYQGSMNENDRKTIRNASKAAGAVGGAMGVFGGENERNAGAVIGGAGGVGTIMTGEDAYRSEMKFKCR